MDQTGQPPEIFNRQRRRALQERALRRNDGGFLLGHIADELAERLSLVSREFQKVLILGPIARQASKITGNRNCTHSFAFVTQADMPKAVVAEEDSLPFDPVSFDLVISAATLDSVNDLPGALLQIRRILKPDGLFLGHMFGAGSLATFKSVMMATEGPAVAPHVHPQVDLRSAADLLGRAGFALPVADVDTMRVRYRDWRSIVGDIRDTGIGNALAGPRRYLGREVIARLDAEWQQRMDEAGKVDESFSHLFMSGWAPSPDQPQPAKRGSGVSLSSFLPSTAKT